MSEKLITNPKYTDPCNKPIPLEHLSPVTNFFNIYISLQRVNPIFVTDTRSTVAGAKKNEVKLNI